MTSCCVMSDATYWLVQGLAQDLDVTLLGFPKWLAPPNHPKRRDHVCIKAHGFGDHFEKTTMYACVYKIKSKSVCFFCCQCVLYVYLLLLLNHHIQNNSWASDAIPMANLRYPATLSCWLSNYSVPSNGPETYCMRMCKHVWHTHIHVVWAKNNPKKNTPRITIFMGAINL